MEPLVIDLPPELHAFVNNRAITEDPQEFVRGLIELVYERWVEAIERIALEAIESGPAVPWDSAEIHSMKLRLREKFGPKN